jgi:hypothetical protein
MHDALSSNPSAAKKKKKKPLRILSLGQVLQQQGAALEGVSW